MKQIKGLIFLMMGSVAMIVSSGCQSQNELNATNSTEVKVAVQLWSVKDALQQDFDGTIMALSRMGFQGVELAGYFGPYEGDPQGLLGLFKTAGLEISSAHASIEDLSPHHIQQTIARYRALGVNTLILPWDDRAFDTHQFDDFLADMHRIQHTLKQNQLRFGYHNHEREFNVFRNSTFWDQLALETNGEFILQLDVGWVNFAGKDPVSYIERYPNRTQLAHFKAKIPPHQQGKYPIIGMDEQNWAQILNSGLRSGGLEWVILEQEEYPLELTPLQSVAKSKRALDKIISQR